MLKTIHFTIRNHWMGHRM